MFILVPTACFIVVFLIFQRKSASRSCRGSFLSASLVCGIFLVVTTELLSSLTLIGFEGILGSWALLGISALVYLARLKKGPSTFAPPPAPAGFSYSGYLLLTGAVLVVAAVGLAAWISPPNTFDSMTYHMSRVVHWIQNGSVAHYPTAIDRQLYLSPWAEFSILHAQILSGSDRFANLIQWLSMIGAAVGASMLAGQLGANLRGQIITAVISVTIPMGVLQGSSTQNDYVVSFWLVCLAYHALLLKESGRPTLALATGACLGIAILTKGTAYIYAFPIMAWVTIVLLKDRRLNGMYSVLLVIIAALAINVGHFERNFSVFGSPLGPSGTGLINDTASASSFASNVVRNAALHIGTPSPQINSHLEQNITQIHSAIGIDVNDPRTSWPNKQFRVRSVRSEDILGNPLHLLLILSLAPYLLLRRRKNSDAIRYLTCLLSSFFLFCILLKWQPWHSRLHLPLFVLWSPLLGLLLAELRARSLANLYLSILLASALSHAVHNASRPLLGQASIFDSTRTELIFRPRPDLAQPYIASMAFLSTQDCAEVGLLLGVNHWEYPFWVLLDNHKQNVRFQHLNVSNQSHAKADEYPFSSFVPCALITINKYPPSEIRIDGTAYTRAWLSNSANVYIRE